MNAKLTTRNLAARRAIWEKAFALRPSRSYLLTWNARKAARKAPAILALATA